MLNEKEKKALQVQRTNLLKAGTRLREQGKKKEAVSLARVRLAVSRKLGGNVSAVRSLLIWTCSVSARSRRTSSTRRAHVQEAVRVNIALHGEDYYHTADMRRKLEEIELRSRLGPADRKELVEADLAAHWAAEPVVRFADELKYAKRAYDIRKRLLGPEHPLTVKSLRRLGEAHEDLSQYAEAQRCLEESVRIRLKIWAMRIPTRRPASRLLATSKSGSTIMQKRKNTIGKPSRSWGKVHQDENAETGDNWFKIAKFYYRNPSHQGKSNYELAAMACRHSAEIREAVLGPDHRRTADSLHILGLCESGHWTSHQGQRIDRPRPLDLQSPIGGPDGTDRHDDNRIGQRRESFGRRGARGGPLSRSAGQPGANSLANTMRKPRPLIPTWDRFTRRGLYEKAEPLFAAGHRYRCQDFRRR